MQSLERMQTLLELGSFEFHLIFLEEAAIDAKIVLVPEQQGSGLFAVASRSTNLLNVIRHADRCIEVHDKFNIGNINTHTEC